MADRVFCRKCRGKRCPHSCEPLLDERCGRSVLYGAWDTTAGRSFVRG
jgi:hypothetical protein